MHLAQGFNPMDASRPSIFGPVPVGLQSMGMTSTTDISGGWLQVPPTHMPWGIPVAEQPTVVRFTAEPSVSFEMQKQQRKEACFGFFHQKRKSGPDAEGFTLSKHDVDQSVRTSWMNEPAAKQHITEEKMAAHLSQLHISKDYTSHQNAQEVNLLEQQKAAGSSAERVSALVREIIDSQESDERRMKRLVLCDEMKYLKTDPVIPDALLGKLQKPSMALVLWQPPAGVINDRLKPMLPTQFDEQMNDITDIIGGSAACADNKVLDQQASQETDAVDNNNYSTLDLNTLVMPRLVNTREPNPRSFAGVDEDMEC